MHEKYTKVFYINYKKKCNLHNFNDSHFIYVQYKRIYIVYLFKLIIIINVEKWILQNKNVLKQFSLIRRI